ncbi:MAG TPA: class I SAM-dependent methyltransferase [Solirubrobacteraceae bacterium]|nr:class I SAM-dependent methyltransferase [Solirubrobacteraceae bacterium]
MTLHPLARQFASLADVYERGRPEHAPAVAGALCAELGLAREAPVLDLAAGTGKLTRALVAAGLDVTAVEPQESLRSKLAASVGQERVLEGLAEAIPLADDAVAAVTIADAFHWFDRSAALAEITRVLRPAGGLAVVSTVPDWREASWAHDLGELISQARPQHPYFDGPPWQEAVREAGGWGEPWEVRVMSSQAADAEQTLAWVSSFSWVAALSEADRAELLARAADLIGAGQTPAQMRVHVTLGLALRV